MQTERELIELIKETYPLNPNEAFVSETDAKLKQMARNISRKRKLKRFSIAAGGLILCTMAFFWFFSLNGHDVVHNTLSSLDEENKATLTDNPEPAIFIYQTHNNESFLPEINAGQHDEAFDETKNITLVGERLSKKLAEKNIHALHDVTDVMGILLSNDLRFPQAYEVSRKKLSDALNQHKSIEMAIDIHRDSRGREYTTKSIDGKNYAKMVFVISGATKNHQENLKFATDIHNKIEKKYPGLSRGVVLKSNGDQQNTYNQDLLDQSVILEIGGVENTLEEEYRSADVLADILKEIIQNK